MFTLLLGIIAAMTEHSPRFCLVSLSGLDLLLFAAETFMFLGVPIWIMLFSFNKLLKYKGHSSRVVRARF